MHIWRRAQGGTPAGRIASAAGAWGHTTKTAGFASRIFLTIHFLLLGLFSCSSTVRVEPQTKAGGALVALETPCGPGEDAVSCLSGQRPDARLTLGKAEFPNWARVSPDGAHVVASIRSGLGEKVAAYDLRQRSRLWRIEPASGWDVYAEDAFFLPGDKVAFVLLDAKKSFLTGKPSGKNPSRALWVADLKTGHEVWRAGARGRKEGSIHTVFYDAPNNSFLVFGPHLALVLDAETGELVAQQERLQPEESPLVGGGMPSWGPSDGYFVDGGLVRFSRQERRFLWSSRFATYAEADHKGKNIAQGVVLGVHAAVVVAVPVLGMLLHPHHVDSRSDFRVGRTTVPALAEDRIVVGALGVVRCFDNDSGSVMWSTALAVPQIARVVLHEGNALVLAGGKHLFVHPDGRAAILKPVRYGLYSLKLDNGAPVDSFRSPFNVNLAHRSLSPEESAGFDEKAAWDEEEDWLRDAETVLGGGRRSVVDLPDLPYSFTELLGMEIATAGLLVVGSQTVWLLDPHTGQELARQDLAGIGEAVAVAALKSVIVVRTTEGIAAFSRVSGKMLFQEEVAPPDPVRVMGEGHLLWGQHPAIGPVRNAHSGVVPLLNTVPAPSFRDLDLFREQSFWILPDSDIVMLCAKGPRLFAIDGTSGATAWEIPVQLPKGPGGFWLPAMVALQATDSGEYLSIVNKNSLELYRLPQPGVGAASPLR